MTAPSAELRLVRIMAGVVAVGALLFWWLAAGAIAEHDALAPPGWTLAAVGAVFLAPPVAAVLALRLRLPGARVALGAAAGLYLLAAFSVLVLVAPSPRPESHWILNNTAAATSAAALAVPRVAAWMFNVVVSVVVVTARARGGSPLELLGGFEDGLYSFAFCAVFIALAQLTVARARRVDEEQASAARNAGAVAATRARGAERSRVDALLHDTVLAALMLASRSGDRLDDAVRDQAREALAALAAGGDEDDGSPADLADLLAQRLARLDSRLALDGDERLDLPGAVAAALADATAEAVRNALRHAALDDRMPTVSARRRGRGVRVEVRDDGVGFDPAAVAPERLGIRSSIVGRLSEVPGATAAVRSRPGDGTIVELTWEPLAARPAGDRGDA